MNYDALIEALQPLVRRVRTDVTAIKQADGTPWTREALTTQRLRHHLNGGPARGVCPIKAGESTTMVGLLDFDSHKGESTWAEMQAAAARVMDVLQTGGLAPVAWRSSGGRGVHVFVLWDEPQDAYTVRQVLTEALAEAGFKNGPKGVARGEVEVFPKQDSVPDTGYGNQFILPLAGKSEPLDAIDLEPMGRDPSVITWPVSKPLALRERPVREVPEFSEVANLAEVKSALDAIPNSGEHELDYDEWRNVVFAIHHSTGGGEEGRALAHEFSGRSGKYDPDFLDQRVWPYVRDREGGITAGTLFAVARKYGWRDTSPDEFDIVDTEAEEAKAAGVEAAKPPKYVFQRLGDMIAAKPLRWIIKGVLPQAQLGVIYGASGSGKSFVAFDMAMSVARGLAWRGRRVKQTQVAYIVAEGSAGFPKRVQAYAQHYGVDPNEVGVVALSAAPNLGDKADVTHLVRGVKAVGEVGLIIVDTLAQTTPGADENTSKDMNPIIKRCQDISAATGALVLLVHHSGKDAARGARGWSGIRAALDVELEVSRQATGRCIQLTKSKDDADGAKWGFDLEVVTVGVDEDGDPQTSCVVRETDVPAVTALKELGPNERAVNEVIQEMAAAQTEGLEVKWILAEAAKRLPEPVGGGRDTRKQRVKRALENLCSGDSAPYWVGSDGCLSII